MTYYVVLVDGVPMDVTRVYAKALQSMRELETVNRVATVVPCIPGEDFTDEEPTTPDGCSCTYEVGSGGPIQLCKYHERP